MKQILQNISSGKTSVLEVPCPKNETGNLLIASKNSLISAGTEEMLIDFGKANYIQKAKKEPDKVKMVKEKMLSDGIFSTINSIKTKLDQPIPMGYCNAGIVLESGVEGIYKGDRVASNGNHAEVVKVPKHLCAKIPDSVSFECASFTTLAAIGLQGIRLVKPTLGEVVVVYGLGLIGLLTLQMLKANGCRVLGIDIINSRCKLANKFGVETINPSSGDDLTTAVKSFSRNRGVDAVLITAKSSSNEIIHQSTKICRKGARIVLIGVVGLDLRRDDFFKKGIKFQVSTSYGPGRYDPFYEEKGHDYPIDFVRWTEQRNFEAVLDMMENGTLDINPLISKRFLIEDAEKAYKFLKNGNSLGILFDYQNKKNNDITSNKIKLTSKDLSVYSPSDIVVGFVGGGNYASRTLIPAFRENGSILDTLVTISGLGGIKNRRKAGFNFITSDMEVLLNNEKINTVAIVTRHNDHAKQVIKALERGKNVFVEKPLAINLDDIKEIEKTYREVNKNLNTNIRLMIGFNRRFAPQILKMKTLLESTKESKIIVITVNAGKINKDHWVQDPKLGGGRIIGEGCHFIDLMRFLIGHSITNHQAMMIGGSSKMEIKNDKATINISFADGSFGVIHYFANGGKVFPKERIEVFCGNSVLQLDNFRKLKGYSWPNFRKMNLFFQDKGNKACVKAFLNSIRKGTRTPIPFEEIIEISRTSIEISESLKQNP